MSHKVLALKDSAGQPFAFATVSQDITERQKLERDRRRVAADLAEAAKRKTSFWQCSRTSCATRSRPCQHDRVMKRAGENTN
jgi:hypothetical protein